MAKEMNTEKKVEALLTPIIEANNVELADVEFVKEGQNWYLRIYIEKDGGVTIDDCEVVSRAIEKVIDEKDPIEQAYILEVSSPGIDRPLKKDTDFIKYASEVVDVKLYKAIDKQKEFQGKLKGLEGTVVTIIDDDGREVSFERKDIASIRLAVLF
ncbi:MAG: ribosome maturation factor RimP [Lachnospiraceae bacterium]|nr:ribosome maturation factor RimP [Lachnospiraceae bacterium]